MKIKVDHEVALYIRGLLSHVDIVRQPPASNESCSIEIIEQSNQTTNHQIAMLNDGFEGNPLVEAKLG